MSLPTIKPSEARRLLDRGAVLIDIREADEHAREKIPGARHLPLSKLDDMDLAAHAGKPVIFHCRSGARTQANAPRLAGKLGGACEAFIVEGGLDAWRKAGLPVATDRRQPLGAAAPGADRRRQPRSGRHPPRPPGLALVLRGAGFRRRGPDHGRRDRLLRHGGCF